MHQYEKNTKCYKINVFLKEDNHQESLTPPTERLMEILTLYLNLVGRLMAIFTLDLNLVGETDLGEVTNATTVVKKTERWGMW